MQFQKKLHKFLFLLFIVILSACSTSTWAESDQLGVDKTILNTSTKTAIEPPVTDFTSEPMTPSEKPEPRQSEIDTPAPEPTQNPTPLSAETWKKWPVIPSFLSDEMRKIYEFGLAKGNNDHAFSILGDCHSMPDTFMGIYDRNIKAASQIDPSLEETVFHFKGSFDRYSPTVAVGTTEGALLWAQWNENKEGYCEPNELPIDCEIRYHKPVIAFVHIGTHWENRNEYYLRVIIEKLLDNGTVPIIVTKADNRELDERVNQNLIKLSLEYKLPVWNFWASVQHLPNNGVNEDDPMYLTEAAYQIHREEGLRVLDYVYRELNKESH